MYGIVGFWTVYSLFILAKIDVRYNHYYIVRIIEDLGEFAMPIIGNLCYLPLLSILLSVFICDKSIDDSFETSYMQKDCN